MSNQRKISSFLVDSRTSDGVCRAAGVNLPHPSPCVCMLILFSCVKHFFSALVSHPLFPPHPAQVRNNLELKCVVHPQFELSVLHPVDAAQQPNL